MIKTDAGNNDYGGQYAKNVYSGETRIVTKLYLKNVPRVDAEEVQQYIYHSDHLGSASLISDSVKICSQFRSRKKPQIHHAALNRISF